MKNPTIMGAIAGDTIGSVFEFNPTKDYNFRLFYDDSIYTDDSIMTVAVAEWLMESKTHDANSLVTYMQKWGRKYPDPYGAYGGMFSQWLCQERPQPYGSWGNGSAMRVGAVGFLCSSLEETLRLAEITALVSHNHPEGIKGAQAVAVAVFLANAGHSKTEIKRFIAAQFGYDLNRSCEEIRDGYHFEDSCQETVPQSLVAFFDSEDFEDAIRLTVSLGGDADTMGAITGAVAAAFYKEIPDFIYNETWHRLPQDIRDVVTKFNGHFADS